MLEKESGVRICISVQAEVVKMQANALLLPWSPCAQIRPNNSSVLRPSLQYQAQFLSPPYILPKLTTFSLNCSLNQQGLPQDQQGKGFWNQWKVNSAEMRSKVAKLGLAAVLAYGLFDAVTYTSFFVFAFLGYEKSTGKNPAANLQALLGIVILMWSGNNITRPFRVGGAAALAPVIDKGLRKIHKYLNFPNVAYAFALVVSIIAALCLTVVALLILSRWGT
ncbi:uncharacterized protein [Euphorbia lathyris]|uniref:uncharacterized protein n=1 Tax=Euphorbia lathyris TaxID=212925 RepID=UPI003313AFC1